MEEQREDETEGKSGEKERNSERRKEEAYQIGLKRKERVTIQEEEDKVMEEDLRNT